MIKLIPAYKDYLWGGKKLKTLYSKHSNLQAVAESWELSTHPDGESIIAIDAHHNKTLTEYIKEKGKSVLGTKCMTEKDIPILVKFIDAKESLSIQVHPDDAYAIAKENDFGKTEMWYILEAEQGAQLVYGFNKDISKEEFQTHIKDNTLTDVLNYIDVKKGDTFFIKPGTVHAIGKGIIILEIQQRSNVTYRIYDFGRVGIDGKLRELQIQEALDVTELGKCEGAYVDYRWIKHEEHQEASLVNCKYFNTYILKVNGEVTREVDEQSFEALVLIEGEVTISSNKEEVNLVQGETLFIPANQGKYKIKGQGELIISKL